MFIILWILLSVCLLVLFNDLKIKYTQVHLVEICIRNLIALFGYTKCCTYFLMNWLIWVRANEAISKHVYSN